MSELKKRSEIQGAEALGFSEQEALGGNCAEGVLETSLMGIN